jgi:hypothetical protein
MYSHNIGAHAAPRLQGDAAVTALRAKIAANQILSRRSRMQTPCQMLNS